MRKFFRRILDIEESEEGRVYLLLANSFFLGVFVVTYDVTVSTYFLDNLNIYTELASSPAIREVYWKNVIYSHPLQTAIFFTGLIGILTTLVFTTLQRLINYSILSLLNLLFVLASVMTITYAFKVVPEKSIDFYNLTFISFALLGALNATTLLGFYGTVSRAFTLKQEKRITGTVDQGGMFATSLAFFIFAIIPLKNSYFYFYFSIAGLLISLVFQLLFNVKYKTNRFEVVKTSAEDNRKKQGLTQTFTSNKYVQILASIFLLSVVASLFVEYSFLTLAPQNFPDPDDLTGFLLYYGGLLTLVSLIVQVFFGDGIIEQYGVRVALLVLPILITFFSLVAGVLGVAGGVKDNLYFFVFIAISKLFLSVAKDSFEDPILKNFFLPIDISIRHDVQAAVEGVFKQMSWALAGFIIFMFSLIFHVDLALYSFVLAGICMVYFYTVFKLYNSYQTTLMDSLNTQKLKFANDKKEYSPINVMKKELQSHEPFKIIYTLKLMEKIEPVLLSNSSNDLAYDPSPEIRKYAINKLLETKNFEGINTLKNVIKLEDSNEVKTLANQALEALNQAETLALSKSKIYNFARSLDPKERELAASLVYKSIDDSNIQLLIDLMRDTNAKVRMSAIISAGKTKRQEYWPMLIEFLGSPMFCNAASSALFSVGEEILPVLETAFYKSGQTDEVQVRIVQLYGRFANDKVIDYLWNKIDFPDKNVTTQVLLSLSGSNFQAQDLRATRIIQLIEEQIGNSAWLIAAYTEIGSGDAIKHLRRAILEEVEKIDHDIFMLLALVYDPKSIQLVRQNIESRTSEGILYAIELLNVFIADGLKPVLFPLLDEISISEKIEKLQEHYLRESFDENQILIEIINRDYNAINRWTKATAILRYVDTPNAKVTDDLVANLFNHDKLLRETSAYVIWKLDRNAYTFYSQRVDEAYKKELDEVMFTQDKPNRKKLLIERVFDLKEVKSFQSIQGLYISRLADTAVELTLEKDIKLIKNGDKGSTPLYVMVSGQLNAIGPDGKVVTEYKRGDLIGENKVLDSDLFEYDIIADEKSVVYKIDKDYFYQMIAKSHEMTEGVIAGLIEHKTTVEHDSLVEDLENMS